MEDSIETAKVTAQSSNGLARKKGVRGGAREHAPPYMPPHLLIQEFFQ